MKKFLKIAALSLVVICASQQTFAQTDSLSYGQNEVRKNYAIYQLAKRFNDPTVARMALYQILIFSGNESAVLDSLALEYFDQRNYISAALVAKENININPKNEFALEIGATSFANIEVKDQALDFYEKLALINNSTQVYYQIAFLQFELKRLKESKATIDLLLTRKEVDEMKMVFPKADKTQQEVTMRAALNNLLGLLAQENGNIDEAKKFYLEALKLSPGFELAQLNLSKAGK